jgi:hypothetical protein
VIFTAVSVPISAPVFGSQAARKHTKNITLKVCLFNII